MLPLGSQSSSGIFINEAGTTVRHIQRVEKHSVRVHVIKFKDIR